MLSVLRTSVKCARPRPFWREVEAFGVVSKDMNSEKSKTRTRLERFKVLNTTPFISDLQESSNRFTEFFSPSGQDGQQCSCSTLGLAHAVVGQRCRMLRHVTFPVVPMSATCHKKKIFKFKKDLRWTSTPSRTVTTLVVTGVKHQINELLGSD